ncbi:hypothetical protein RRG08_056838 [Elysia crispata]|uniref:Uncharacterized protein n=1 Tax=Elysia crispata TaxID=231223 RepID=A0AAE1ABJ7_9GAST|nr:hypothetical protein RRG08_056838 [Elysia crispata]
MESTNENRKYPTLSDPLSPLGPLGPTGQGSFKAAFLVAWSGRGESFGFALPQAQRMGWTVDKCDQTAVTSPLSHHVSDSHFGFDTELNCEMRSPFLNLLRYEICQNRSDTAFVFKLVKSQQKDVQNHIPILAPPTSVMFPRTSSSTANIDHVSPNQF